jgi:hypothetical protein
MEKVGFYRKLQEKKVISCDVRLRMVKIIEEAEVSL